MSDWNDIRYVMEVWRTGSTLAASRNLHVSQSTVMRRIAVLEAELGLELFDKRRSGYSPTSTLTALLPRMNSIEAAHIAFDQDAQAMSRDFSGVVTISASELICSIFLNNAIAQLHHIHPGIKIELLASDRPLELSNGEADIVVRAGGRPQSTTLFGRRLAEEVWSFYCSTGYAEAHGIPRSITDLADHSVLAPQEKSFPPPITDWFRRHIPDNAVVMRHTSLVPVYYGVKSGLGVSVLSDFLTIGDKDLIYCFTPPEFSRTEIWLLTHERHRKTARVRAVMSSLGDYFDALRVVAVANTSPA